MGKLILFLGVSLVTIVSVSAQTGGQIAGEVRDPSGAFIPNAAVTVTNTATNASRSTTTNSVGMYSFPTLFVVVDHNK